MSTKKRFSIAPDLASGLRSTIQSASVNQGQLHYDMMALDVIEPDPKNPRQLLLSPEEVFHGVHPTDAQFAKKTGELEALRELSASIKKIGVKNAIEVFKEGNKYRIITGERRYWAARLAEQKTIPVRISTKPDEFNLRYTQWVENINRQDLSLLEKFNNLLLIADAYKKSYGEEFNEQALQRLLGVSTTQAYRYYALLKADEKIIQLLQHHKLNNLKIIYELVSMKDQGARNQIISWILTTKDEITSLAHFKAAAGKKPKEGKVKSKPISLGKINKISTAKYLLQRVLSDPKLEAHTAKFNRIDWNSPRAVTNAFKDLFKILEQEVAHEII